MSEKKDKGPKGTTPADHDESTIVFTNVHEALATPEEEVSDRPAALLAVGGAINGALFNLHEGETILGRGADTHITLEFKGISRHHLKIVVKGEKATVEDLGSRNGTFVNNTKIEGVSELQKQDIVKIGSMALKYIPKGDPERLAYDKLTQDASTDAMTGCYNRAFYNNAADLEVRKCKVTGQPLSLIIFDFDFFKKINDNYGHPVGDYVLQEGAKLIRSGGVREQDIFARVGGEEFVILLPKTNIKQAFEIAERVRRLIEEFHFVHEQKNLPVTISVGVSDFRPGVETAQELYNRADKALYVSKEKGRNQVNFFRG